MTTRPVFMGHSRESSGKDNSFQMWLENELFSGHLGDHVQLPCTASAAMVGHQPLVVWTGMEAACLAH